MVDGVWTSQFGGELDKTPDEYRPAQWNQVEDERREREHEDGEPRQPRYFPRQNAIDDTYRHTTMTASHH